jgi:predicted extracellular nuclease
MSPSNRLVSIRAVAGFVSSLIVVLSLTLPSSNFLNRLSVRTVLADNSFQTLPFSQNWTNTGLITTDDNWTGVPGIIGYRGDALTGATGADPQLIVADGSATPVDVNANRSDPDVFATGGVTEFDGIANPVVALNGSGTADAPHIVIHLNTTGTTNINVTYNLRDIDGSVDNAVQPVALQYRIGATGNYTNLPAGFIADATTGGAATLVTPVNVTLPVACENQAQVELRVMTTNAVGNDEWVGIDDISVTGTTGGPPTLGINDVSQAETDSGTTTFTFTVSLTSPAGAGGVTFDIATADGTAQDDNPATEDNDYVAKSETGRTITSGNSSAMFTVDVNGDTNVEPNETFFVNVTNITGATAGDVQGQGTITNDDVTLTQIHTIQGSGDTTPIPGNAFTTGIVTLLRTSSNAGAGVASGFFLQTPDANADADPNTSEGIFVFTSSVPTYNSPASTPVAVGDELTVTGTATEFNGLTEINSVTNMTRVGTGNPLPAPIPLTTTILDPAASPTQPQLEKFEAMRMAAGSLVSVAPNDSFFDVYAVLSSVARPFREPGIDVSLPVPPDPTSGVPDPNVPRWDENPERLKVDTNARAGAPNVGYTSNVTFTGLVGPLDFAFAEYRLIPDAAPTASANMSAVPVPVPLATEFTVAGFNIENFNNDPTQRAKAALAIRDVMRLPDIIGTVEIFDLTGLQALASEIQTIAGETYAAHLIEADGTSGDSDQDVGFLVKTSRVQINSVTQEELPGCVGTAATCNSFINPNTGLAELLNDRPPLVLRATVDPSGPNPIPVIVVVNHLRSFIDIESTTVNGSGTEGGRVRAKRKVQSEFLAQLLDDLQDNNPGNSIMSVGDYNAYQFNDGYTDPMATIKGSPTADDQVVVDQSPDLVDPDFFNLTERLAASERYSFIFQGTPQALDHIVINRNANARYTRNAVARFDSDFPDVPAADFATNASRPERASDHDALVAYFNLTTAPTAADGTVAGRITDANGIPIAGAVVNLSGTQNRKFITDVNGNYRFDNVETNGFYTVRPSRANYSFSPAERSFSQIGNSTEAVFTGTPAGGFGNPLDTPEYFVRQHYLDFLNREPDESGFNFWSDQILGCGEDFNCIERRTINVSAAYFLSIEFQETGGLVDRLYRASYGRAPLFSEFMPDTGTVARDLIVGDTGWEQQLATNKQEFLDAWVQRAAFRAAYDNLSDDSYVDTLISHTGVNFTDGERAALVSGLTDGMLTRAQVLQRVAQNERFVRAKFNEAFVRMQYFGYLRRDPDDSGFHFWLNKLNEFDGNFERAEMVKAFIVSGEYRDRFLR